MDDQIIDQNDLREIRRRRFVNKEMVLIEGWASQLMGGYIPSDGAGPCGDRSVSRAGFTDVSKSEGEAAQPIGDQEDGD